jgi:hypothetical protein
VNSFVGIAAVAMRRRLSMTTGCRCEGLNSTKFRKRPSQATLVGQLENVLYLFYLVNVVAADIFANPEFAYQKRRLRQSLIN